ncbi:MAG: acyl-ACP--UDP-N-acetylglucosamine O-acyltransferase [Gemmataceae bacterium]
MSTTSRIHPTALIAGEAVLADDVRVGPYAVIDGAAVIGPGCDIRAHAMITGRVHLGQNNVVFPGAVLGEQPQHVAYKGEPTTLEVGDGNMFRENVTIHRGTTCTGTTKIGNQNFFMANSHVAHDCVVGNRCIFANGALVGGHCTIEDNVFLSGNSALHQFVHVGRLALLSGCSASSKDVPPFVIQQRINAVVGVNVIGMKRAGMSDADIQPVRKAFKMLFREGLTLPTALARIEEELGRFLPVAEMLQFIRQSKRGINFTRDRDEAA